MQRAEKEYADLQGFQLLRSEADRKVQLERQKGKMKIIKQWIDYWSAKYDKLAEYFGFNKKLLG
jgi:hypothetical protein